jgi:hypothetical protein
MATTQDGAQNLAQQIAINSTYGATPPRSEENPYLLEEFTFQEYVNKRKHEDVSIAEAFDFGIDPRLVSDDLAQDLFDAIAALSAGGDEAVTTGHVGQLLVRLLEERSVAAIDKVSGEYAVSVTDAFDADGTYVLYVLPQNMATLMALTDTWPRTLNGLDTDYAVGVHATYRLHRRGGSVYAAAVETTTDWGAGEGGDGV